MRSLLQATTRHLGYDCPIEHVAWHKLNFADIATIRSTLLAAGKSNNTVNTTLSAIRGVLRTAFELNLISLEHMTRLNRVAFVRGDGAPGGRALSKAETRRLIGACRKDTTPSGLRDLAVIMLMITTGLRRAEIAALGVDDYDSSRGELSVHRAKGRNHRTVYLAKSARLVLNTWITTRALSAGPLFCPIHNGKVVNRKMSTQAVYDIVKRRSEEGRIGRCSPHDLRRTFCTRLLEGGVDIHTVSKLAGHRNLQTTARYDRRDEREQRRVARQIHAM